MLHASSSFIDRCQCSERYFENSADDQQIPTSTDPTWPNFTSAPILWNPLGPRPAEQVRVLGTVSTSASTGPQTTFGKMVERGQAGVLRGIGRFGEGCRPHLGLVRVLEGQRTQQGDPMFCRNRTIPEDRPVREKGRVHPRLHFPLKKRHACQHGARGCLCSNVGQR